MHKVQVRFSYPCLHTTVYNGGDERVVCEREVIVTNGSTSILAVVYAEMSGRVESAPLLSL